MTEQEISAAFAVASDVEGCLGWLEALAVVVNSLADSHGDSETALEMLHIHHSLQGLRSDLRAATDKAYAHAREGKEARP